MTTPLFVSVEWLNACYTQSQVQVLDARLHPPGLHSKSDSSERAYLAGHLPQAPFFNLDVLCDTHSPFAHMMPRAGRFAVAMRELGVHSDRHLVIYDEGNLFSAPRAWWMLRQFGVEQVSILAGGLASWRAAGLSLQSGAVAQNQSEFEASEPQKGVIKNLTEMLLISHDGSCQIIDARPANRFRAEADEPREGVRRGHIPGALNVPWSELAENGALKPDSQLREIFIRRGVDLKQPIVASCGSGVTAAVVLLALTQLGVTQLSLYDGSWCEWGSRDDLPGVIVPH